MGEVSECAEMTGAGQNDQWHELKGKVKVPQQAATLRLRCGFRNARGTCWIDDVSVESTMRLAVWADLVQPRVTPELGGVPVLILNRDERRGEVSVKVRLGTNEAEKKVELDGTTSQRVVVPIEIPARKELVLEVSLVEGKDVFAEKRRVSAPAELILSPAIPTHWAIEDGPARIGGDVDIAITTEQRQKATVSVKLVDPGGKALAQWSANPPEDGLNPFALRADPLPAGEYNLVAELKSGDEVHRAKQKFTVIHREESRTVLNQNGYLEYRGKLIFPLGIFNGPAKVVEMGQAGFTINHAYNAANAEPGERPNDEAALRFIDDTQKNGMMALFLIPRGLAFSGDWEGFRRRIRMFRNHPALLAWDEEEGIARGDMDTKALETMRRIIAEEDPNHPFMVGDSRDVITNITDRSKFFPLKHMDLGMWWWYPIPAGAGKENMLEGDEYTKAMELTPPSFLTLRNTDKPLWVGVQSYKKPTSFGRYPTPEEYRAQAYIAIIHGTKGLMWYGGSVEGGIFLDPKEGKWEELKKLVRELRESSDVFMGETMETPKLEPASAPVSVAIKRSGNRLVLMAVNRGVSEVDVLFSSPVFGESRNHQHHFGKYETHVYEWSAR